MSNATLLPPNTTALERRTAQVNGGISDLDTPLRDLWRPDTCPAPLLPWLAWALSEDEWDAKWSENRQRRAIKAAIGVHRRKGTIGAVKRALAAIDYDVSLIEWHQDEPPGAPYTFRAEAIIEDRGLDAATQAEIIRLINAAKDARSHLTKLRLIGSL
ncbi:phage tail protein I [Vreelandella lionensis]|uniref:phage tail protein I n=1 Tax=Vreelandella lionensis TaxID=1144478 RepID=UPI0009F6F4E8|nr:phage tail protein I [Halomonas lionensis]